MRGEEFKKALELVGLTLAAPQRLGLSPRHAYRIARGDYEAPAGVAIALLLMIRFGLRADELEL